MEGANPIGRGASQVFCGREANKGAKVVSFLPSYFCFATTIVWDIGKRGRIRSGSVGKWVMAQLLDLVNDVIHDQTRFFAMEAASGFPDEHSMQLRMAADVNKYPSLGRAVT